MMNGYVWYENIKHGTNTAYRNGLAITIGLNKNCGDINEKSIRQQDEYELFVCYGCCENEESCLNN